MPFAVEIETKKNIWRSRCVPVFATREEARRYGQYLRRQKEFTVIAWDSVEVGGQPNATFARGRRRFTWGAFEHENG